MDLIDATTTQIPAAASPEMKEWIQEHASDPNFNPMGWQDHVKPESKAVKIANKPLPKRPTLEEIQATRSAQIAKSDADRVRMEQRKERRIALQDKAAKAKAMQESVSTQAFSMDEGGDLDMLSYDPIRDEEQFQTPHMQFLIQTFTQLRVEGYNVQGALREMMTKAGNEEEADMVMSLMAVKDYLEAAVSESVAALRVSPDPATPTTVTSAWVDATTPPSGAASPSSHELT